MNETELTVVVCTLNREKHLEKCLRSLANQTIDNNLYEVLIINNNSTDNTQTVAETFTDEQPNFRIIQELNHGLSICRNRGWKEADGKYIAYIDDDAKAHPGWCEKILNAFKTVSPRPVAVGGVILPFYERKPPFWFSDNLEIYSWGSTKTFLKSSKRIIGFAGSNMAFPKMILRAFGGFSPRHGMSGAKIKFGEEIELFNRIYQETPLFWYDPEIKVFHWISPKKMQISHRMLRAFKAGIFTADLDNSNYLSPTYIKSWIHHRKKIEGVFSTNIILWLEQFARGSGYVSKKFFMSIKNNKK